MRRSLTKFSESEASDHTPSWADFITTTPELKFSVHTRPGETMANDDKSPLMASAKKPNKEIPKTRNK
jgi:hypothetical protein